MNEDLLEPLKQMTTISLEEMGGIRLMNRIDTKYVTHRSVLVQLLNVLKEHYYVQQIDGKLVAPYRTIYWDTPDHIFFRTHQSGCSPRYKVRVRTYLQSDQTFLEVKKKDNHGRTKKKRIEVPDVQVDHYDETESFLEERCHTSIQNLKPKVQNQFERITLVNKGKTERLTIDFNIRFHNFETGEEASTGNLVVVELKRDGNVFSPVKDVLRDLRVFPSGFSKYCIGTVMTNHGIKANNFKPKMVKVMRNVNAS